MSRPRLLDLFCCAGGASMGYHRAGFDVTGVDLEPQPDYPFAFEQADALDFPLDGFDAVHASPPCQMFTAYRRARPERGDEHYVNLIPETRARLEEWGGPWIIENVPGAPLNDPLTLCGSMFEPPLDVRRHRLFESSIPLEPPAWPCRHKLWAPNRFPGGRSKERTGSSRGLARNTAEIGSWDTPLAVQQAAIGIDWMPVDRLSQAIPPAYTEFLGRQLLARVLERAA